MLTLKSLFLPQNKTYTNDSMKIPALNFYSHKFLHAQTSQNNLDLIVIQVFLFSIVIFKISIEYHLQVQYLHFKNILDS